MIYIEIPPKNRVVTESYLKAIGRACSASGRGIKYVNSIRDAGNVRTDAFVVANATSASWLFARGARDVAFWAQGVWPEESYARRKSRVRFHVSGLLERQALLRARRVFLVSVPMLEHYEHKYKISISGKTFVMACSNEALHAESFFTVGKFHRPTFVYAGSLAKHQCINETLELFKHIHMHLRDASLLFLTHQTEEAMALVEARGVPDVVVRYVDHSELSSVLAGTKYGFVLRDSNTINRVSTPTKLSTYIANGIIPIYSNSVRSFSYAARNLRYRIECGDRDVLEQLIELESESIAAVDVLREYSGLFRAEFDYDAKHERLVAFMEGFAR